MPDTTDRKTEIKAKSTRSSRWSTSAEAVKHIAKAFRSENLKVRLSDQITLVLLGLSIALAVAVVVFPQFASSTAVACDIFFAMTIVFFIAQRLGIVTTFNTKQTVFATELMFGFLIAGIFIVVNLTIYALQLFR